MTCLIQNESWTRKKAECQRIDAFELWCWRRLLRVPWTAKRSNQWIRKEISPECSLEGLMLKLKFPILWPPDAKSWVIWKDPDAGRDWGQEEQGTTEDEMAGWHHWLNGNECGWTLGVGDGQGGLALCGSWHHRVRHGWVTELNSTGFILKSILSDTGTVTPAFIWFPLAQNTFLHSLTFSLYVALDLNWVSHKQHMQRSFSGIQTASLLFCWCI